VVEHLRAAAGLTDLFAEHDPPLVLKSDNGSAFISELFGDWAARRQYPIELMAADNMVFHAVYDSQQKKVWNSEPRYHTEEEMVDYFRAQGVSGEALCARKRARTSHAAPGTSHKHPARRTSHAAHRTPHPHLTITSSSGSR
jgi:hypothetical protein